MKAAFYEQTGPAEQVLVVGDLPDPDPYPFWHQSEATGGQNYSQWDNRTASNLAGREAGKFSLRQSPLMHHQTTKRRSGRSSLCFCPKRIRDSEIPGCLSRRMTNH